MGGSYCELHLVCCHGIVRRSNTVDPRAAPGALDGDMHNRAIAEMDRYAGQEGILALEGDGSLTL